MTLSQKCVKNMEVIEFYHIIDGLRTNDVFVLCIQVYSKLRSHKIEYFRKSDFKSEEEKFFK